MKKIVILIVAALAGMSLSWAQNFRFQAGNTIITEGMTLEVTGVVDFDEVYSLIQYFTMTNLTDNEMDVRIDFTRDNLPEGATLMICGWGGCRTDNYVEGSLDAGGITGGEMEPLDLTYSPDEAYTPYTSKVKVTDQTSGETLNFNIHFVPTNRANNANENRELAGVSVYPNPADGLFNLNVPARAQVEIFSANGQVVRQMEVGAGQTSLQLNNAGIYFIRVRANGKQAVKRLVVR